jgi:hypothetical protein
MSLSEMPKHEGTFKRTRYVAMISDDDDDDEIPIVNTPPRSTQRIHERNNADEDADVADEDAPIADEDAPIADEDADVADEDADVADEDADVADEDADVADEDADVADEDADVTIVIDEDAEVADEDAPIADEDADVTIVIDEDAEVADEDADVADEDADVTIVIDEDAEVADEDAEVADEDADVTIVIDEDADDADVIDAPPGASSVPSEPYPIPEIDAHSLGMIMSKMEDRPGVVSSRTIMRLMNTSKFFRYACSSIIVTRMDSKSTQSLITMNELLPELLQRVTHISLYRANRISEIAFIPGLGMPLKVLNISHTKVTSIAALATLPELEELYCSSTLITTLTAFNMNGTLKLLDVSSCHRLNTNVVFPIFMALENLDLSGNSYDVSMDLWNCGDLGIVDPLPSLKMWRGREPLGMINPLNDMQRKLVQLRIT